MTMNTPAGDDPALAQALERLTASRAALRGQLLPAPRPGTGGLVRAGGRRRAGACWRLWRARLQQSPVAALLMERLRAGWQGHPWSAAGELLVEGARERALPWVRRHPEASVALAAAGGAALVALRRPLWRVLGPSLRGASQQLGRGALRELGQEPWRTLLAGLIVAGVARSRTEGDPDVR